MAAGDRTSLRRRTLLAAAVAVMSLAGAANALADPCPVDLQVVDRQTGRPLQVWRHDGRLFVAGRPGARYSLRVANHTDGRVLVVMSVDGVNIVSGETAGYDQRGYIFGPNESYDVTGWRKSTTEVAAFTFAPLPQSYAARTGRPADVGVIGMAVFNERAPQEVPEAEALPPPPQRFDDAGDALADAAGRAAAGPPPPAPLEAPEPPPPPPPAFAANQPGAADKTAQADVSELVVAGKREERGQSAPAAVSAFTGRQRDEAEAERRTEKLGTGHGARERSVTNIEPFDRATPYPQYTQQLEYDTYDNLVASGVIPSPPYGGHRPRPFPSSPDGAGFVPDPPRDP